MHLTEKEREWLDAAADGAAEGEAFTIAPEMLRCPPVSNLLELGLITLVIDRVGRQMAYGITITGDGQVARCETTD